MCSIECKLWRCNQRGSLGVAALQLLKNVSKNFLQFSSSRAESISMNFLHDQLYEPTPPSNSTHWRSRSAWQIHQCFQSLPCYSLMIDLIMRTDRESLSIQQFFSLFIESIRMNCCGDKNPFWVAVWAEVGGNAIAYYAITISHFASNQLNRLMAALEHSRTENYSDTKRKRSSDNQPIVMLLIANHNGLLNISSIWKVIAADDEAACNEIELAENGEEWELLESWWGACVGDVAWFAFSIWWSRIKVTSFEGFCKFNPTGCNYEIVPISLSVQLNESPAYESLVNCDRVKS